jgi:hypothetical protein
LCRLRNGTPTPLVQAMGQARDKHPVQAKTLIIRGRYRWYKQLRSHPYVREEKGVRKAIFPL